jgi:hypothetical protein
MSAHSEAKKAKLEHPANHYNSPDEITNDADLSEAAYAQPRRFGRIRLR